MKDSPIPVLGELETAVLDHLWRHQQASAKAVHAALGQARGCSLSTVQSTLERLHRKQLVSRQKSSHAYSYAPQVEREALVARMMRDVLERFNGDFATSLSAFVDTSGQMDPETVEKLENLLRERRDG
ncbi:MAG: BlaI/MecI/CopY family transcriptional regulator [Pseudohongiellaceae bacterium]